MTDQQHNRITLTHGRGWSFVPVTDRARSINIGCLTTNEALARRCSNPSSRAKDVRPMRHGDVLITVSAGPRVAGTMDKPTLRIDGYDATITHTLPTRMACPKGATDASWASISLGDAAAPVAYDPPGFDPSGAVAVPAQFDVAACLARPSTSTLHAVRTLFTTATIVPQPSK